MSTINGTLTPQQNRESITFTPNIGGVYGGRYQGPIDQVKDKMDLLIAAGYSVRYECDSSPIATLDFSSVTNSTDPGGSAPVAPNSDYTDNFQVIRNTVQKELLVSDHPLVAGVNALNLEELRNLMKAESVKLGTNYVAIGITGAPTWSSGSPTSSPSKAQYLLDLHRSGVTSIEVKQPVLRVTRVTNPLYDAPFDVSRVDKVLSTATMISDSGVPSNFAIPLLSLASACARSSTTGSGYATRSDSLGLKYGWLKDAITSETIGTTRNQYVVEYKFGLWDVEIYGQPL